MTPRLGFRCVLALIALAAPACGDDIRHDQPDSGAADAAAPDAPEAPGTPDAGEPVPDAAEAPDAGPVPSDPDASPDAPVPSAIERVFLENVPDVQIRQGGTAVLVVEGSGLGGIGALGLGDAVTVAPLGGDDRARRYQLTVAHGHPFGDVALAATTADGALDVAAAITVTPFVYAPDGSRDGRGTYSSPLRACNGDTTETQAGDTKLLLAGTYECVGDLTAHRGAILRGEGPDRTIVAGRGYVRFTGGGAGTTELRDLAIARMDDAAVFLPEGEVVVDNVRLVQSGIYMLHAGHVRISRLDADRDAGPALSAGGSSPVTVDLADSRLVSLDAGVSASSGRMTIRDTHIDATSGILAGDLNGSPGPTITMSGGSIRATIRAINAHQGSVTVERTAITAVGTQAYTGMWATEAALTLGTGTTVRGFAEAILIGSAFSPGTARVQLDGVDIEAREIGVVAEGSETPSELRVRNSRIQGRRGLWISGAPRVLDLGTAASSGENVISGSVYAIDDQRQNVGTPIDAVGSVLSGVGTTGTVTGPADVAPRYRLRAANQLRM
jgi:hypothetical protein